MLQLWIGFYFINDLEKNLFRLRLTSAEDESVLVFRLDAEFGDLFLLR